MSIDFEVNNQAHLDTLLTSALASNEDFSISCWGKMESIVTNNYLISDYSSSGAIGWWVQYHGGSNYWYVMTLSGANLSYNTSGAVQAVIDTWYHVAVTFHGDGSAPDLWINGVAMSNKVTSGTPNQIYQSPGNSMKVAAQGQLTAGRYWDGEIKDMRLYEDHQFTQQEVDILYNSLGNDTLYPEKLLLRYRMDSEGDGDVVTLVEDLSGNGNNPTVYNSPTYKDSQIKTERLLCLM